MNKPCPHIDLLHPFMDGELPPEQIRFVEDHLAACRTCSAELYNLRKLQGLLMDLDDVAVSPDFDRLFWQKIDEYEKKKLKNVFRDWFGKHWRLGFAPLFATLVLFAGTFFMKDTRTVTGGDAMMVQQMDLFQDFDVVNNLDLLEEMAQEGDGEAL